MWTFSVLQSKYLADESSEFALVAGAREWDSHSPVQDVEANGFQLGFEVADVSLHENDPGLGPLVQKR